MSSVVGQPVVLFLFKYQLKLKFPDFAFFVVAKAHKKSHEKNAIHLQIKIPLEGGPLATQKTKTARGSGYVYCNFGFMKGVIAVLA